jgi:hypothetical protein
MEKQQIPGIVGSILLAVGLFVPIARVLLPSRNINYFGYGNAGKVVLGLAIVSLIITLLKKYKALWITGLASLGLVLYDLYDLQSLTSKARLIPGNIEDPSAAHLDSFQRAFLEEFILKSVALDWKGWAVMITGVALIIVAALIGGLMAEQSETFVSTLRPGDDESKVK